MKRRLAMLACLTDFEGAWTRVTGSEREVRAVGLGEGDTLLMDVVGDGFSASTELMGGVSSLQFPDWATKYRVRKMGNGGPPCATTVEVICG